MIQADEGEGGLIKISKAQVRELRREECAVAAQKTRVEGRGKAQGCQYESHKSGGRGQGDSERRKNRKKKKTEGDKRNKRGRIEGGGLYEQPLLCSAPKNGTGTILRGKEKEEHFLWCSIEIYETDK